MAVVVVAVGEVDVGVEEGVVVVVVVEAEEDVTVDEDVDVVVSHQEEVGDVGVVDISRFKEKEKNRNLFLRKESTHFSLLVVLKVLPTNIALHLVLL